MTENKGMKMMGFRDMQYRHSFGSYSWLRNDSSLSSVWSFWLSVKGFRFNRDVLSKVQGNVGEVRSDKTMPTLFGELSARAGHCVEKSA